MTDPLEAVSPLDGRYRGRTAPLAPYASEGALIRARVRVEIEYLIALADLDATPLHLDPTERDALRDLYRSFDDEDAALVKRIETEGYGPYDATNHDVKAVEYFIRERRPGDLAIDQWIHFGLTSEDVNNVAHRLLVKGAVTDVVRPAAEDLREALAELAVDHRDVSMLAHTHGQPATPTTFGKEMAVYADRLDRGMARLDDATAALAGKIAGASGTYAAHAVAYPSVDWPSFVAALLADLDLAHAPVTTQVNPCDDLAVLFDALRGINRILIDLDRDVWLYVSKGYVGQTATGGETGSSTMPHKINPIDFENGEGNLSKANADLVFLGEYVTTSRLQRDLSDSTVKRNIGAALAHCLIGYTKTLDGLDDVSPNVERMRAELREHPEVLAEAVQTILRREGHDDAYERLKAATRGTTITLEDLHDLLAECDVSPETIAELVPAAYVGIADELVDGVE